jgi:hypothetical protein
MIGSGLMMLCQMAAAVPGLMLLGFRIGFAPSQFRRPKWIVVSACFLQSVVAYCMLGELGSFSKFFDVTWLLSMALILLGYVLLAAWPGAPNSDVH